MNQELIQKNIELAKGQSLETKYFVLKEFYGTMAGNRRTVCSTLIHAIVDHNGKQFNRTFVDRVQTHLYLNHAKTKQTEETHEKKVVKMLAENNIVNYEVIKA